MINKYRKLGVKIIEQMRCKNITPKEAYQLNQTIFDKCTEQQNGPDMIMEYLTINNLISEFRQNEHMYKTNNNGISPPTN